MSELPFISVIVPTHKRPKLLRRALQSIKSQPSSVFVEAIVVSDVIDDDTDKVCAELLTGKDVYIRRNGSPGPSASRNMAAAIASGRYVMFLDDDDAWHTDCVTEIYANEQIRQGAFVYFNCSVVQERRGPDGPEKISEVALNLAGNLTDEIYVKNQIHMSCFAFPREMLQGIQFDTTMRAYEDWEFLLSVIDRKAPSHAPVFISRVFEVSDDTTDRRGNSKEARDLNAVFDYLYVYRRHPAPRRELKERRASLMNGCGIAVTPEML